MHKVLSILVLGVLSIQHVHAQGATPVTIATPNIPEVKRFFYDGSSNLQYVCIAKQKSVTTTWRRSDSTLTSIVVSSNVATVTIPSHFIYTGVRVTVSGATVDTDLNGTYTLLTTPTANTFTFATTNVANATYNEATLVITTDWPPYNSLLWAIQVLQYTSTTLDGESWADSNVAYNRRCSDRAIY